MAETRYGFVDNGDVVLTVPSNNIIITNGSSDCCNEAMSKLNEIIKDAPTELDTFVEVAENLKNLSSKVEKIEDGVKNLDNKIEKIENELVGDSIGSCHEIDLSKYAKKTDLCKYLTKSEATLYATKIDVSLEVNKIDNKYVKKTDMPQYIQIEETTVNELFDK